ncbi:MAG: hypothetical protein HC817_16215 [Saprospiraceae bacterium]|nr:hypothetical protein [Saprospiraceae bacterium]
MRLEQEHDFVRGLSVNEGKLIITNLAFVTNLDNKGTLEVSGILDVADLINSGTIVCNIGLNVERFINNGVLNINKGGATNREKWQGTGSINILENAGLDIRVNATTSVQNINLKGTMRFNTRNPTQPPIFFPLQI